MMLIKTGTCVYCKKVTEVIEHHECYIPEVKVDCCRKCHNKVHIRSKKKLSKEESEISKRSSSDVYRIKRMLIDSMYHPEPTDEEMREVTRNKGFA